MATITKTATLVVQECCECGIDHAIPQRLYDKCFEHGGFWYCPNGHRIGWVTGEKARQEADLKNQLEREKQKLVQEARRREILETELQYERRSVAAYKGQATRLRKRIANGSCPVCHRNFSALHRHMKSQHPDYVEEGFGEQTQASAQIMRGKEASRIGE